MKIPWKSGRTRTRENTQRSLRSSPSRFVAPPAVSTLGRKAESPTVAPLPHATVDLPSVAKVESEAPIERSRELDSPLSQYMRDAGEVALLSAEEEVALARRVQRGDLAAREHMIRANLRLVIKIAREYEHFGLPLLDLINEGNIGLMRAVERFDPAKGCKFSTYAALWIKQAMRRGLANQSKTIRLPINLVDRLSRMNRHTMELQERLGRVPTTSELAEVMELPSHRIRELRRAVVHTTSLDAPLGSDEDSGTWGDVVEDSSTGNPYQNLEEKTLFSLLNELVSKLNSRESMILRYRFGLDGGAERTLEEVGVRFGVTRERIRQLQNTALGKLRKMIEDREAVQRVEATGTA